MSEKKTVAHTLVNLINEGIYGVDEVKGVEVLKSDTIRLKLMGGVEIDLLIQPKDVWMRDEETQEIENLNEFYKPYSWRKD
jgi:hypothetical protein